MKPANFDSQNICSECSIPPNFIYEFLKKETECNSTSTLYGIMCRDCGDYWEESDHEQ